MTDKIKIRKWYIFTEYGINAFYYILDLSNEDVNNDEIAWCIQKQVYNKEKKQ